MSRLFILAGLFLALCAMLVPNSAAAQSVASKILCEGTIADGPCDQLSSTPKRGDPVYYQFVLYAGATPVSLPVVEDFPSNFAFFDPSSPVVCTVSAGPGTGSAVPLTFVSGSQPLQFTASLLAGQEATCAMQGTFTSAGGTAVNTVSANGSSDSETTVISPATRFDQDLKITKQLLVPVVKPLNISGGAQTAKYRITVTSDKLVYLGDYFRVYDQLALFPGGVSVTANLKPGASCKLQNSGAQANCILASSFSGDVTTPGWKDFASWGIASGSIIALMPGDALVIEYEIEYSVPPETGCVKAANAEGIRNRAFIGLAGSAQALKDDDDGNNDTAGNADSDLPLVTGVYNIDPACNAAPPPGPASTLQLSKIATHISNGSSPPPVQPWPGTGNYVITLSNPDPTTEIFDVEISDIMENQPGTPNFRARLIRAQWVACVPATSSCVQTSPNPPTNPGTAGPLHSFDSYYARRTMWTGTVDALGTGQTRIDLQVYLHSVDCDYAPLVGPKRIRNWVEVRHKMRSIDPQTGLPMVTNHTKRTYVDITVEPPPVCQVAVSKTSLPTVRGNHTFPTDRMIFGEWKPYRVTYSALPSAPATLKIGTLIDAIRIENAFYATGMQLQYQWQCADLSGGGVRGFQQNGNGNAVVNHVGAPHQGVRIMDHPGIVEFDPGASLECNVRVKVEQPSKSDPFCLAQGQPMLQNLALMDGSLYFNANMPWPHAPKGSSWDTSSDKLPHCYNLVVNKNASTGVVAPSGGPVTFKVQVINAALPGTGGDIDFPDGAAAAGYAPYFSDRFRVIPSTNTVQPNAPAVYTANNHCPGTATKRCEIFQAGGVDNYGITKLPAQQSLTIEYTVAGPYDPDQFCNYARGWGGGDKRQWYEYYLKDPVTWDSEACVLVRGSLEVTKRNLTPPWVTFNPATQFTIDVECDTPSRFNDINRSLAVSNANPAGAITQIPIGSTCEIEEVDLPNATQWGDCKWESPAYPSGDTVLIDGSSDPHRLQVLNILKCEPEDDTTGSGSGDLQITKSLISDPNCVNTLGSCIFRITVQDNANPAYAGPIVLSDVTRFVVVPQVPVQILSSGGNGWSCAATLPANPTTLNCQHPGNAFANGPSSSFDVEVKANPAMGDIENCINVLQPVQLQPLTACVTAAIQPAPSLSITKELLSPQNCPAINAFCKFRITVTNNGAGAYSGPLQIKDVFSNTLTTPGAPGYYWLPTTPLPAGWQCNQPQSGNNPLTCNGLANIAPGGSFVLEIEFDMPNAGTNCAFLMMGDPPQPQSCVDVGTATMPANLSIAKTKITPGSCHGAIVNGQPNPNHCTFAITITNNGTTAYTGPVSITDTISPNFNAPVVSSSAGWSCSSSGAVTGCNAPTVSIPAGGSITLTLVLNIDAPLPASENCVTLDSPLGPAATAKPRSCVAIGAIPQQGVAELTLTKSKVTTQACQQGALSCQFRFAIKNTGTGSFAGALSFEDQFLNGTGYNFLSVQQITPSGWNCMLAQTTWTCTNPLVSIPVGATHTVDILFDYGPGFSARLNCARLVQGSAKGPDSCTAIGQMRINKELVSPNECAAAAQRQCTFRITVSNGWAGMYTGPVAITDAVDFGGVPQITPIVGTATNGWTCVAGAGGTGLDCTHPGPIFPTSGVATFEVTLDLTAVPPVHIGNCAEITAPAQPARERSCVPLGAMWEPPMRVVRPEDLPRNQRKLLDEARKKLRGGFKLPKVRINVGIGLGGILGGGKRSKEGTDDKPERTPDQPKEPGVD